MEAQGTAHTEDTATAKAQQHVDEVLHARWIVPVVPSNTYLENHSLVIHQGKILDILPTAEAKGKYTSEVQHVLEDHHALMPGLVNMHSHAPMTLLRGFSDDVKLQVWLEKSIWPAEARWVSEEFCADGTRIAVAEMIRCGVTCFNDMYHFPNITAQVASDSGMKCCIGIPVLIFPSNWASNAQEYMDKGRVHLFEKFKNHPLVSVAVAPHAPYTCDDAAFRLVKEFADEHKLPIHCHVHETSTEVVQHIASHDGVRPLQRLHDLGLLSPSFIAVHMTQLTDEEIQLCAKQGVHVVHCPESNMKLASGMCPVARLLDAGVNVCIGTDSAASNDDLDMMSELRTASLLDKLQARDTEVVPAWQILHMATMGGAKALGLDKEIGSLEIGKSADVVAVHMRTEPVYNPITHLVYVGTNSITDSWIAGKAVLKDGKLLHIDEAALQRKAREWGHKISQWRASASGAVSANN
eukprot:TRINITY_DN1574_c0_g1_i4.p1 TRINITY_DN1574_c0_g1~~TRINITY_DN1574_c0_g1_i4.p1  ORF type:complete len:467 (+),score=61.74 TRINITY_DN1574_c0_g1_i4:1479-2879(+)